MADKNYAGTQYMRAQKKETRLVEEMTKRAANGKDRENVDPTWSNHTVNTKGERVWSF